jgi:hypothetical protein
VYIPAISDSPTTCAVLGDACVIEGDVVAGTINNGRVRVSGLLAQRPVTPTDHAHIRRLSFVKGYNAFLWPDGVVTVFSFLCRVQFVLRSSALCVPAGPVCV